MSFSRPATAFDSQRSCESHGFRRHVINLTAVQGLTTDDQELVGTEHSTGRARIRIAHPAQRRRRARQRFDWMRSQFLCNRGVQCERTALLPRQRRGDTNATVPCVNHDEESIQVGTLGATAEIPLRTPFTQRHERRVALRAGDGPLHHGRFSDVRVDTRPQIPRQDRRESRSVRGVENREVVANDRL